MKSIVDEIRRAVAFARLRFDWFRMARRAGSVRRRRGGAALAPSLVLVPCEPWSVVGSRGDEAMVYSILRDFRRRRPDGKITVVTGGSDTAATDDCARIARDFGAAFDFAWRPRWHLANIFRAYEKANATEVFVLGADCMDGHWSAHTSLILLGAADLASRMGAAVRLTGFSWNESPAPRVVRAFRRVSKSLPLLVRDPVSLDRFQRGVRLPRGAEAAPVADVAFNLTPRVSPSVARELGWMDAQRGAGRCVLGFNLHSMLVAADALDGLVAETAAALRGFLSARPGVAVAFIPHDYRCGGDLAVLSRVSAALPEFSERLRLVEEPLSAEELKGLCGGLDALFTSRMHLGIAALGMGKPVAAFAYQGKFAGLFRLAGLPEDLILSPREAASLPAVLARLLDGRGELASALSARLPSVLEMAKRNLVRENA